VRHGDARLTLLPGPWQLRQEFEKQKDCSMTIWTNDAAISQWVRFPGDLRGRRVLDAGCGQGYFSRILADRGAEVVGVEPGQSLIAHAAEQEAQRGQGIRYLQADLCGVEGRDEAMRGGTGARGQVRVSPSSIYALSSSPLLT
jgi:2-polyprenyl-3-methyl-5-hydroxy-6-metoxy-1,4-benzoquinol methylase